jgi:hypothetical protein
VVLYNVSQEEIVENKFDCGISQLSKVEMQEKRGEIR